MTRSSRRGRRPGLDVIREFDVDIWVDLARIE
jgi:hypothetical protein